LEILEGEVVKVIQVADGKQALVDLLGDLLMAAGANLKLAKIRMTYREIATQIAQTMAIWAVNITCQVG
jgi:predicted transcriptional regulator